MLLSALINKPLKVVKNMIFLCHILRRFTEIGFLSIFKSPFDCFNVIDFNFAKV